ncbi:sensor domain-containing diguanylate cyclase [Pseudomonas sp. GOM7]|uniref:sensor domain-containing diguanylate cyclase n=1 Tax=Pseudomonas sp. GOM7 TaxID=2998079 RepID=UPI00227D12E1|nr:sensor domain-containing diguanylate cyclase [Pseudomonas sp. GOM7]WAJ39277.1 sensor domain-containing diguanylate cyclase [Pseudomonas sp. GOM7]
MRKGTRLTSALLLFICLSLASLAAWQIWFSRERALHDLNLSSLNLAQALDNYSEGVIRQSELVLLDLIEHLQHEGNTPASRHQLEALMRQQSEILGIASAITVYDAHGKRQLSSVRVPNDAPGATDRRYFTHHRDNPSPAIFIGPTVKSRVTGDWVFSISRRLDHADGQFAGVVVVTLGVEHFLQLFGSIKLGEQGSASLSSSDGTLLFRHPFREQDVGLNWSNSPILKVLQERDEGTSEQVSRIDGIERLYAFRRNSRLPLITVVALGRDEALAPWRHDAQLFATLILMLLVSVGVIGQRLLVDIRRRTRAERKLLIAQEELLDANARLEVLASQDALTGLANRRSFDQTLEVEIRRALRRQSALSLVLLDIDYFKRYNDRYGHIAGDTCLRTVAEILKSCIHRPGDLAARYGGEELALILPNTDADGAEAIARTFMTALQQRHLTHQASPFGTVTVSLGIASLVHRGEDSHDLALSLIQAADQALYQAKSGGRDCLQRADSVG